MPVDCCWIFAGHQVGGIAAFGAGVVRDDRNYVLAFLISGLAVSWHVMVMRIAPGLGRAGRMGTPWKRTATRR